MARASFLFSVTFLSAISAGAAGCTHAALPPASAIGAQPSKANAIAAPSRPASVARIEPVTDSHSSAALTQAPGDYVVYRFSGSFRKHPITLTQRVVAVQGAMLTVDSTLQDGARKRTVRATFDKSPGAARELVSAVRTDGASPAPLSPEAYESFLAETILAADANEETLGTENVTLAIGAKKFECTKTSYRVLVGSRKATMSTLSSADFAWGDVGGEIRAKDGKLLYRVEVVDAGNDVTKIAP